MHCIQFATFMKQSLYLSRQVVFACSHQQAHDTGHLHYVSHSRQERAIGDIVSTQLPPVWQSIRLCFTSSCRFTAVSVQNVERGFVVFPHTATVV